MSDASQGPGWWQASDGKWYPPEQAPGYQAGGAAGGAGGGGGTPGTLDIGAALSYGWNKFVQYIGQIIVIILIIFGVQIAFNIIGNVISGGVGGFTGLFLSLIFSVAGLMISFILQAGLIRVGLAIVGGREPEPGMLFQTENIGPFAIAVDPRGPARHRRPVRLLHRRPRRPLFTLFYGYYVIDKGEGPTESIGSSFALVKDNAGSVIGFAIIVVVLNLITCGLAIGVTQIALAYAYKSLNGEPIAD